MQSCCKYQMCRCYDEGGTIACKNSIPGEEFAASCQPKSYVLHLVSFQAIFAAPWVVVLHTLTLLTMSSTKHVRVQGCVAICISASRKSPGYCFVADVSCAITSTR